jgi:hypothetical protein
VQQQVADDHRIGGGMLMVYFVTPNMFIHFGWDLIMELTHH